MMFIWNEELNHVTSVWLQTAYEIAILRDSQGHQGRILLQQAEISRLSQDEETAKILNAKATSIKENLISLRSLTEQKISDFDVFIESFER